MRWRRGKWITSKKIIDMIDGDWRMPLRWKRQRWLLLGGTVYAER